MGFKMTDILPPAGWPNVRQLETDEFAAGGANGNMNEQAKSLAARSELLKQYAALPYESKTGGYALNERVQLATGDIVRSTIPSNVNNPNVDMTGWVSPSLTPSNNLGDVADKEAARNNLSVYSKTHIDSELLKKANVAGRVTYFSAFMNTLYVNTTDFDITIYVGFKLPANSNVTAQVNADVVGFCTNYNTANKENFYTIAFRVPPKATYKFNTVAGNPSVHLIGWQA